ncbi:ATP-binding cassette domain-containing protein [Bacillus sp. 165]|uniref:ABC transporter ATP-binding protein n=1 Tax=Bacillus sp. 165 TaxID=1529117 RepID=UPI001ADB1C99|nr:ATP-binding cassette domain-containing protein [Bacillus sp. 165]
MTLEIRNLKKSFGSNTVVDNLQLSLHKGDVLGLLGRNGAGKTTTIKMILGLLTQDNGDILWNGKPMNREEVSIGYLPEERGLYVKTKVVDQLRYFAELEGMTRKEANAAIDDWLNKLEIPQYKHKKASELSKGNQQKIQLIATLIHNPELIILDEPFSGLDPVNASMLASIIEEQIQEGKTVIFSSHRMEQVESFCKHIIMLNKGKTVLSGNLQEIKEHYGYRNLTIPFHSEAKRWLDEKGIYFEATLKDLVVKVNKEEEAMSLLADLQNNGISLRYFKLLEPTLHEIFVERAR